MIEDIQSKQTEHSKKEVTKTEKYWINYGNKRNLDIQCGNSAYIFGYSDRDILNAISANNIHFIRNSAGETSKQTAWVINELLNMSGMSAISWAVSGSDAVESAIALNDQFWNNSTNKILSIIPNYHGTTYMCKSLRKEVFLDRIVTVDRGTDAQTLERIKNAITKNSEIGCIIVESIPWVEGVNPYSNYFWSELRSICDQFDVNLLIDDVAGSFGKLGFAFSHSCWNIKPDIVAIAKSLTGGYSPLSAALCNEKIHTNIENWDHSHTWNPNCSGISAANVVIQKTKNGVFNKVKPLENRIKTVFENLDVEYQGQGLIWQINRDISPIKYFEQGLTFNIFGKTYLPIVLPLIADEEYFEVLETRLRKSL